MVTPGTLNPPGSRAVSRRAAPPTGKNVARKRPAGSR